MLEKNNRITRATAMMGDWKAAKCHFLLCLY